MRRLALFAALLAAAALLPAGTAGAHEVRPGYLEIRQTGDETYALRFKVPARGELRLGLHARLPESCAALAPVSTRAARGAWVDRWTVRCPGGLTGRAIAVDGLSATLTDVLARLERADGTAQVERLTPAAPSFVAAAAPAPWRVAWTYLGLGVEHILLGVDHLLFVLALMLVVAGWRKLVATITAFTVAHSITLALATLGFVHVPGPPVEAVIALSIVFVAAEIVHGRRGSAPFGSLRERPGLTARAPWIVAFTFGLLHGFGFAGALSEVGLPQKAIPLALLTFNVGVEAGQLLFIAAMLAARAALMRLRVEAPEWSRDLPPYAIGSLAAFWMIERVAGFW